jgi:hypothetical protein
VEITAALAADLAILTQALDEADADIAATLRQLILDARTAVHSYLGLTVSAGNAGSELSFTAMEDHAARMAVRASLTMPLHRLGPEVAGSRVVVILYATTPGAFVDLAAELSWLAALEPDEFALDQQLNPPVDPDTGGVGQAASLINQAIGVLVSRGRTLGEASDELDARAADAGHSRYDAATAILASVATQDPPGPSNS